MPATGRHPHDWEYDLACHCYVCPECDARIPRRLVEAICHGDLPVLPLGALLNALAACEESPDA